MGAIACFFGLVAVAEGMYIIGVRVGRRDLVLVGQGTGRCGERRVGIRGHSRGGDAYTIGKTAANPVPDGANRIPRARARDRPFEGVTRSATFSWAETNFQRGDWALFPLRPASSAQIEEAPTWHGG